MALGIALAPFPNMDGHSMRKKLLTPARLVAAKAARKLYTGDRVTVVIGGKPIHGEYIEAIGSDSFGFLPDPYQGMSGQRTVPVKNVQVTT